MQISRGNLSFEIDPFEHESYWVGIANGDWEEDTFELIDRFVYPDSIALDVGSWAGPIALYLACRCQKVYAMEPDPAIYHQLTHNLTLNGSLAQKVITLQLALAAKDGKSPLYAREKYGLSSSSLLARSRDLVHEFQCGTISLKSLIEQEKIPQIDFIKIDIEGGEFPLLTSWGGLMKELNFPTLYISFHYWQLKESIYLKKIGNAFLSRLLEKVERLSGISFYRKACSHEIQTALTALTDYEFVYNSRGKKLSLAQMMKKPELIQAGGFVFTQEKW